MPALLDAVPHTHEERAKYRAEGLVDRVCIRPDCYRPFMTRTEFLVCPVCRLDEETSALKTTSSIMSFTLSNIARAREACIYDMRDGPDVAIVVNYISCRVPGPGYFYLQNIRVNNRTPLFIDCPYGPFADFDMAQLARGARHYPQWNRIHPIPLGIGDKVHIRVEYRGAFNPDDKADPDDRELPFAVSLRGPRQVV